MKLRHMGHRGLGGRGLISALLSGNNDILIARDTECDHLINKEENKNDF